PLHFACYQANKYTAQKQLTEKTIYDTIISSYRIRRIIPHHFYFYVFYVYLIKNEKNEIYTGCTSDLRKRIAEHNKNRVAYTKHKGLWEIRYYEAFSCKYDAFKREKSLKRHARGTQELKERLAGSLK
ncbi:MAG: hypothetical protein COZ28_00225, partial [Candidatus Moranbacteria bacterium CG_4_10_14_3_um_filter_44_15]